MAHVQLQHSIFFFLILNMFYTAHFPGLLKKDNMFSLLDYLKKGTHFPLLDIHTHTRTHARAHTHIRGTFILIIKYWKSWENTNRLEPHVPDVSSKIIDLFCILLISWRSPNPTSCLTSQRL